MTIYNKTAWKDHIVDSGGQVVQQGTPLSAGNLNRIEEGLANATAMLPGELGAATAHSGVLDHGAILRNWGSLSPGEVHIPPPGTNVSGGYQMRIGAIRALIAGQIVTQKGLNAPVNFDFNDLKLPDAPTEGTRDDLLFLEAWRDQSTQAWQTRIRIASGVDFSKYSLDGFYVTGTSWANVNRTVTGQGGNTAPLAQNTSSSMSDSGAFVPAGVSSAFNTNYPNTDDQGLYITGNGSTAAKASLKTYDGYVYAIPLFKVNRRNSGGYSVNNANGAKDVKVVTFQGTGSNIDPGKTKTVTFSVADYNQVAVGEEYYHASYSPSAYRYKIISKNGSNQATVQAVGSSPVDSIGIGVLASDRPDGLYSNIIDERDITDLRHKTYLVAPSYEQLLIDGTDQILRGSSQVERKKSMRKTYVGVRKTPLDANHVFYASFDGSLIPEIGSPLTDSSSAKSFVPMNTGAGITSYVGNAPFNSNWRTGVMTFEAWVFCVSGAQLSFKLSDTAGNTLLLEKPAAANMMYATVQNAGVFVSQMTLSALNIAGRRHIRMILDGPNKTLTLYVDGNLIRSNDITSLLAGSALTAGNNLSISAIGANRISDVAISNISRGATFATLPADFIAGYADITPALSDQRQINSDSQTSQKSYAVAKVKNQTQERSITVTKGAGTNTAAWEAGDKIKVKGIAGEIISGVIDSDTALATIRPNPMGSNYAGSPVTVYVDDVSKLSVGDKFTAPSIGNAVQTISAIDTTAKTVTFDNPSGWVISNAITPTTIYETTASTSSPVVRAIIAGSSTPVPGNWTALGTNEAEITLVTPPVGLVSQDIIIEHSLNMPAGQGSLYQVYTNTLGGEANGKKLIPGTVAVTDDFAGKVAGSTTANPHKAYSAVGSVLATPSAPGAEFAQADYDAIKTLDNSLKVTTTSVNGQQAQAVVSVDVIRSFEDKYGKIPGAFTVAEKVAWIKASISSIVADWYGYGVGPSGNKASMTVWKATTNVWQAAKTHTAALAAQISFSWAFASATVGDLITADGFIHFTIYADASDGVAASILYSDYFKVDIQVNTKAGYDTLVPENSRRDAGLGGVLYVRKETREVESLFPGNDEDNGISIIGDYVPTQEIAGISLSGIANVLFGTLGIVTTAGTNKASGNANQYKNSIARILGPGNDLNYKVDPQALVSTIRYEDDNNSVVRYWPAEYPHAGGIQIGIYTDGIPTWAAKVAEFLCITPRLVLFNGELLLRLDVRKRSELTFVGLGGGMNSYYYRLPGRPLIKI